MTAETRAKYEGKTQQQLEEELCDKKFIAKRFRDRNQKTDSIFIVEVKRNGIRLYERHPKTKIRAHYVDIRVSPHTGYTGVGTYQWIRQDPPYTCRCWYRTIPAQCVEKTLELIMATYHQTKEEILTPQVFGNQNLGARNAFTDRSLKNPFHPKWKNPTP